MNACLIDTIVTFALLRERVKYWKYCAKVVEWCVCVCLCISDVESITYEIGVFNLPSPEIGLNRTNAIPYRIHILETPKHTRNVALIYSKSDKMPKMLIFLILI